jgi:hypothetical protein
MSILSAVSSVVTTARRTAIVSAGLLSVVAATRTVHAQSAASTEPAWALRFTSGALVGTGAQRDVLKDAQVSAVQLSWLVHPAIAITGSFAWARSRDLLTAGRPRLDVFTSDAGVEVRPMQLFADRAVTLRPFVGAGVGARSYNYRKLDVDATNNLAGYAAVGGELAMGRVGLRLEARDYATGFKPLIGAGTSATRNDVVITAGLSIKRGASPSR